jgi:hypothetical protein
VTEWPTTSCSSRAIRARSSATAARASLSTRPASSRSRRSRARIAAPTEYGRPEASAMNTASPAPNAPGSFATKITPSTNATRPTAIERTSFSIVPAIQKATTTTGSTTIESVAGWTTNDSSATAPITVSTATSGARRLSSSGSVQRNGKR